MREPLNTGVTVHELFGDNAVNAWCDALETMYGGTCTVHIEHWPTKISGTHVVRVIRCGSYVETTQIGVLQ